MPLNIDWQQILLHLFNFCILALALYFLLYKPVKKFMAARTAHYKEEAAKSESLRAEAEALKAEYSEKLSAADSELELKRSEALHELHAYREKLVGEAEAEADAIVEKAKKDASRERKKIIDGAGKEIADMVGAAAEKIVLGSTRNAYEDFLNAAEKSIEEENELR